jgi:SAM-dependent methyltransferase
MSDGQMLRWAHEHYELVYLPMTAVGKVRRSSQIRKYFDNDTRLLMLGSDKRVLPGWLSVDKVCVRPAVVYMDATKRFPFPDASFDAIACEHLIEHVSYAEGQVMLRECRRILKLGGVLRLSTPDLDVVRHIPDHMDDPSIRTM